MITYYFRGEPYDKQRFRRTLDSLCSWNGTARDVMKHFGQIGMTERVKIIAQFDDTTTPWTLVTRTSSEYSFKDARSMRGDFPKFYIGLKGDIWDSDSYDYGLYRRAPSWRLAQRRMSYLVFWSANAQRKKRFLARDIIKCSPSHYPDMRKLAGREVCFVIDHGRRKAVVDPVVFDVSIIPPKLVNVTLNGVSLMAGRHPRFPEFYVSPAGHIRESASGRIVMAGGGAVTIHEDQTT